MARHVHANVIHAYAEGETIQYRANGEWVDFCEVSRSPNFFTEGEYRIKPKPVKKEGWIGLYSERSTGLPYCQGVYATEEEARELGSERTVVKISWEQEE